MALSLPNGLDGKEKISRSSGGPLRKPRVPLGTLGSEERRIKLVSLGKNLFGFCLIVFTWWDLFFPRMNSISFFPSVYFQQMNRNAPLSKQELPTFIRKKQNKTRVITLANHKRRRQSSEPIRTRSKCM